MFEIGTHSIDIEKKSIVLEAIGGWDHVVHILIHLDHSHI